jgi:ABC-type multidrug transport system fused ATPase/permease subunit
VRETRKHIYIYVQHVTFSIIIITYIHIHTGSDSLTPERAFTSLALLGLLSSALGQIPSVLTSLIGMQVSAERIENFLRAEEFHEILVLKKDDIRVPRGPHKSKSKQIGLSSTSGVSSSGGGGGGGVMKGSVFKPLNLPTNMSPILDYDAEIHMEKEQFRNELSVNEPQSSQQQLEYSSFKNSEGSRRSHSVGVKHLVGDRNNTNSSSINKYGYYLRYLGTNEQLRNDACKTAGGNAKTVIAIQHGNFEWRQEHDDDLNNKKGEKDSKQNGSGGQLKKNKKNKNKNKQFGSDKRQTSIIDASSSSSSSSSPNMSKLVLKDINLTIDEGSLVAVIGSVGSGKSSLLYALLNELQSDLYHESTSSDNHINTSSSSSTTASSSSTSSVAAVACCGRIAFCCQEPWILNQTLKDNILFGDVFDQDRYDQVVEACALRPDFECLMDGDKTEIGERGINLRFLVV